MELTKEQKGLLNIAKRETANVLKNADTMSDVGVAWELWFAYDAISSVYHQVRDAALDKKTVKETT